MASHKHLGGPGMTQNQGNVIGDKPCVRQSRLYREHCGGNAMKALLGQDDLAWDLTKLEGAYKGQRVHDGEKRLNHDGTAAVLAAGTPAPAPLAPIPQDKAPVAAFAPDAALPKKTGHRRGAGEANKSTINLFGA